jgi:predicted Rossmann fold flavoprotein
MSRTPASSPADWSRPIHAAAASSGGPFTVGSPRTPWPGSRTTAWPSRPSPTAACFPSPIARGTVSECLERTAREIGVRLWTRRGLARAAIRPGGGFDLGFSDGSDGPFDALVLATGGNREGAGFGLAAGLGHTIVPPVPSLFTFGIRDPRIEGLAGLSSADAEAWVPGTSLRQRGPVLITHWGLSGPAILKLSSWGARVLHDLDYRFDLHLAWVAGLTKDAAEDRLRKVRTTEGRKQVRTWCPWPLPQRLWESLARHAGIAGEVTWAQLRAGESRRLAAEVTGGRYAVTCQSLHKDEFVTCGGVHLPEVDFRTMESRVVPRLFLAGEILDIDGITGGFNFQAAWTTGHIAGESLARLP